MKITAQQYILNKKNSDSFVVVYKSIFESRKKKSGKDSDIYILFKISSHKNTQLARLSKFVVEAIVDGYLYSISKTTNEALKESLEEGISKLKNIIKNDKDLEETGIDVSFTVVLVRKEGVYVGNIGENEIFLCKKNKCVDVTEIMKEKNANTAGLVLDDKESLIISTSEVLSPVITKISGISHKEEFAEALNEAGKSLHDSAGLLYLSCTQEEKEVKNGTVEIHKETGEEIHKERKSLEVLKKMHVKYPQLKEKFKNIEEVGKTSLGNAKDLLPSDFSEKVSSVKDKVLSVGRKITSFIEKAFLALKEKIYDKLKNKKWFRKAGSQVSEVKLNAKVIKYPVGSIRIDDYKIKQLRGKRFKILFLIILIVGLLIFGINFTKDTKEKKAVSKDANEKFTKIEELVTKAESLALADKSTAETYIFKAENIIKEVPENLNSEDADKFEELKSKYTQVSDNLQKKIGVSEEKGNLVKYIEPRLSFGEGSDLSDVEIFQAKDANKNTREYLAVADKGRRAVYIIDLSDKSVKTLNDDQGLIKEPKFLSIGVEGIYIYDEKSGVLKAPFDEANGFGSVISMSGLARSDIKYKDVSGFIVLTDADNAYFLTRDTGAVLKSSAAYSNRYSLLYPYMENESFKQGTDIMGDLSVYVTTESEPWIVRYSWSYSEQKQTENPISITGLDGNAGNITCGYTYGESMDNSMLLFDAEGKRILRLEKPIESGVDIRHPNQLLLLGQYEYRGSEENAWSQVKDVAIDMAEKNMYVVESSMIWKVSL